MTGVTVSIGQDSDDGLANDRDVVVRNLISQIYGNYTDTVHAETNAFFVLLTNCRKGCEAACILRMMIHVYHFYLATILR